MNSTFNYNTMAKAVPPAFNPRMFPDNHPELFPYVLLVMILIAF